MSHPLEGAEAVLLQRLHINDLPLPSDRILAAEILSVLEVYAADDDLELFEERLTLASGDHPGDRFVLDEGSVRRAWPYVCLAPALRLPLLAERIARVADSLVGAAQLSDYPHLSVAAVREMRL